MKIQSRKTSWLLPVAMAVAGLMLLMAATAQGQGTGAAPGDLAQPEALPLFWAEDFSDPLPPEIYYITATTGSGIVAGGSFMLTQDALSQRGRIFYLAPTPMVAFGATFRLSLGDDDGGADGAAFHFCPVYDYPPDHGGSLDALCPGGYLVAFDTYEDGGGGPDRVYVAHETPSNRLVSEDVDNLEDWSWHTIAVLFRQPVITVTLDGSDVIAGAELTGYTPFLGYFGFSAATGGASNEQRVDDIQVHVPALGALGGHVYDDTTGEPIERATVSADGFATDSDATGYYSMTLPAGTYDVTGSAFGYLPATIPDVTVITDETTVQDITLTAAPSSVVDGYVTDAATGWPLYASIDTNSPAGVVWTDPGTGYYSISLPDGMAFDLHVEAWVPGYVPEDRVVGPLGGDTTEDFALDADLATCIAPGYEAEVLYSQDFEADNGGFSTGGAYSSWQWGAPTSGPGSAHSGVNVWATNLAGNYNSFEISHVESPDIDLSPFAGSGFSLSWWQWLQTATGGWGDSGWVGVSNDGGTSWTLVFGPAYGDTDLSWAQRAVLLDSSFAVSNFRVRFALVSRDPRYTSPGWYVDDIVISRNCQPQAGGLVVGNVYDENTLDPLAGAKVENDTGGEAYALPTPGDPNVDDAFYILFTPPGDHDFTASFVPPYGTDGETVTVVDGGAVGQDFFLAAPHLVLDPEELEVWVLYETAVYNHATGLDLINDGGLPLEFEMQEVDSGDGVAWFWEDPISGTVPAETTQNVAIGFTALYTDLTPMPLGDYYATLDVDSNDAISATRHVPVIMHIVEQYIAPTASFESNSPVCLGETAIFANTTIPGIPPKNAEGQVLETTYLWDFGDGETSTEFEPTHDYAAAGTYGVTLEACNPVGMCDTYADAVGVIGCNCYLPLILKNY